jgi:hypothetical protein
MIGAGIRLPNFNWLLTPAHQFDETVVNDFDHLLPGGDAIEHLLPDGALPDILDQIPNNPEIHIGLEQGHADLLQRGLNVLLIQTPLPFQFSEDAVQFFGQILKHVLLSTRPGCRSLPAVLAGGSDDAFYAPHLP